MKIASVDIGTNAVKSKIFKTTPTSIKYIDGIRSPIRLGSDVFKKGKISEKAYKLLDFSSLSSKSDIRKKFKEVVKSLHPDTNGGDNSQEDLLKEVISAYKTLKSQGHC